MMDLIKFVEELSAQGIELWADGERLRYRSPRNVLPQALLGKIKEHKTEILQLLRERTLVLKTWPEERYEPFPLTDLQQAYWVGRSGALELGSVGTHIYLEFEQEGLDLDRFSAAWIKLIDRHDMLRAVVLPNGEQQILEQVPTYEITTVDLRGVASEEVTKALEAIREELSHQVLSTEQWPLFEIRASLLDGEITRLHVSLDMLIADLWSWILLIQEWGTLYEDPELQLPALEISFRDYVLTTLELEQTALFRRSREYWWKRLEDLPSAPELPLRSGSASRISNRFERRDGRLGSQSWNRFKKQAAQVGLTPSGALLAVYAEVLASWSRFPRFTINVTGFSRLPLHPQVGKIAGDFNGLTLVAIDGSAEHFSERAIDIQRQLWSDTEYGYINGVQVLRERARQLGRAPGATMPVVFTSGVGFSQFTENQNSSFLGKEVYGITQTPQVWLDHQTFEKNGELVFNWDYVEAIFPPGLVDDMFTAYCHLLDLLSSDEEMWRQTSFNELLLASQLAQRAIVNETGGPVSSELLHTFFVSQAHRRPGAPAIIASQRTLSYGELLDLARRTAHWLQREGGLQRHGVAPNTLVGVVMEKGWEQVVAVLGILMVGGAYLPIDVHLPSERRNGLLADSRVRLLLTQPKFADLQWADDIRRLVIADGGLAAEEPVVAETSVSPEDLAYVIYTSGSTGTPKGVMIDHRGAVNTILDINRRFAVTEADRVLCLSALNFDLSVYDIFGVLAAGGVLVMPKEDGLRDPAHWRDLMMAHRVTLWDTVPALKQMLVDYLQTRSEPVPEGLRLVMMSGDWIPLDLPERIRALWPSVDIIGLGGATEASIWSNFYSIETIDPDWKSIPYGKPLTNQTFQVLDSRLEPCPVWVPGDLYIGGMGLAKGYWNDPEKTEERFITHPRTGERLYKTGDLGRYLPDGNLEFLGRIDNQVKIRGHRIELGEVEAILSEHPGVKEVAVTAVGSERDLQALAAYIVPSVILKSANEAVVLGEQLEGIILDPVERLEFMLKQPGLRSLEADLPEIPMAVPEPSESIAAYLKRKSYRVFLQAPISRNKFDLFLSCLKSIQPDDAPLPKYRYPSAGNLYPVQCYLYIKPGRIEGLDGGIYYHHPIRHTLVLLSRTDNIGNRVFRGGNAAIYEGSAFAIFLIGNQSSIDPMYSSWSRDFSLLEAGYMGQLLMEVSPQYEIGLCPIGALDFSVIEGLFRLEEHHILLHTFLGGGIEPEQIMRLRQQTATSKPDSVSDELEKYANARLPAYMVPSTFTVLDALPLTPTGKIDRKALPDSQATIDTGNYEPPRTAEERYLATIWSDVLDRTDIGIHDNFFDIGGDSVLGIQIIDRAQQVGLGLTPRDVLEHHTIAELAQVVQQVDEVIAQQGLVRGDVPLTPIQSRFFAANSMEPWYHNQAILLEVPADPDESALRQALSTLLRHHDVFRLRYRQVEGNWQQTHIAPEDIAPAVLLPFHVETLSGQNIEEERERCLDHWQASLDLEQCPLTRLVLFRTEEDARLLWVIHHLIVDGVSWHILLEDLNTAYNQAKTGQKPQLLAKTTSFKVWGERLQQWRTSTGFAAEALWWRRLPQPDVSLPMDYPEGANRVADTRHYTLTLDTDTTRRLLQETPAAYRVVIDDLLLVALLLVLRDWTGQREHIIDIQGHGRTELYYDIGLGRTVGCFTALYSVVVNLPEEDDPGTIIKSIKGQLRKVPHDGVGYGLLRQRGEALPQGQILFSYLGRFGQTTQQDGFRLARGTTGQPHSLTGSRDHILDINGITVHDQLSLTFGYSGEQYLESTIQAFVENYRNHLQALIEYC
uniref:Non-ribosomal peptide synthase domain TIGR01720/amino acid adenylation domain-containing protein n=1 Tax=Candidatus Kentrum sp. LFY TaxID=2126342 RepID=A0A450WJR9_9GAMM|nr:MAG: non-ribosomal peptide synthase domain TIGR01720/amino acid adenylation domain-containing protein [Candidatus Kentron sp. LFY]